MKGEAMTPEEFCAKWGWTVKDMNGAMLADARAVYSSGFAACRERAVELARDSRLLIDFVNTIAAMQEQEGQDAQEQQTQG